MTSTTKAQKPSRFFVLDGMRGAAALVVMVFHLFPVLPYGLFGHGYLAVDFFFLLSGFVISYTYDEKFADGMRLSRFAAARAIRLYPLVVAGVASVVLIRSVYPIVRLPSIDLISQAILNALLLPNWSGKASDQFPLLGPSWSLFFELLVNIIYAMIFRFINRKILNLIIIITGTFLIYFAIYYQSVSLLHHHIFAGICRTSFSFFVGVLIFRNLQILRRKSSIISQNAFYIALLLVLILPVAKKYDWIYELLCIFAFFPILLIFAIKSKSSIYNERVNSIFGELSYPIYILHMPFAEFVGVGLGWAFKGYVLESITAGVVVAGSFIAWKTYDVPIRRLLTIQAGLRQSKSQLRVEP